MNKAFIKEPEQDRDALCPRCGSIGLQVSEATLAAQAKAEKAMELGEVAFFCPFARCEVAYFDLFERYLTTAWESGAQPVVVLTKADLCLDLPAALLEAESVAIGAAVCAISNVTGDGIDLLVSHLQPAQTVVLLGSSGVGKSTLLNRLAGRELMRTADVAADGTGRHTTTHRELVILPSGALVIDTPGLRELQLYEGDIDTSFQDVEALASECRFRDCAHTREPGCAVLEAVDDGRLGLDRLRSWRKLQRELESIAARTDRRLRLERKRRWKQHARSIRKPRW